MSVKYLIIGAVLGGVSFNLFGHHQFGFISVGPTDGPNVSRFQLPNALVVEYEKKAELGNADAALRLALFYKYLPVERTEKVQSYLEAKCHQYLARAVELGHPDASFFSATSNK